MDRAGQILIAKQVRAQIEVNLEAACFEAKICGKVDDSKGLEQVKVRVSDLEKRIQAADELINEAEGSTVKTVQIV